jgi:two-component system sensor histidine kinase MtrB
LRGSPIPLEPKDSRRNRGLSDAGLPPGGADKVATVPAQQAADQIPPLPQRAAGVAPTVDPTALPGNGARVVARPASTARRQDETPSEGAAVSETPSRPDTGPEDSRKQGEAFRGR